MSATLVFSCHRLIWNPEQTTGDKPEEDCRLQLACMKPKSLVIAGRPYGGEFIPGPCSHRPSHYGSGHARSRYLNRKEGDAEGRASDWSEVVTR
ncbi:UNVERIFIED_CONTAM: hypothetical protein Sradi_2444400 [Sesamum radiatum]|uniref:Uncharacterized protein n=1 Tax=Sesamum radiatum TaxID=300843 RepID=A0AAW2SKR3_SESRA